MVACNRSITKYFKQRVLKGSVRKFLKNREIIYPDWETRRNEPKCGNILLGREDMAELPLFKLNACGQKSWKRTCPGLDSVTPLVSTHCTKLKAITNEQKQAALIVFDKNRCCHLRPLLRNLKALNIYEISLLLFLNFMYRVKIEDLPNIFKNTFEKLDHK